MSLALIVLAVIGLAIGLGSFLWREAEVRAPPTEVAPPDQKAQTTEDYGWLVQAMAECEEEAKRSTDKLFFLIAPVVRTGKNVVGWASGRIGTIGHSTDLLPSSNAVIGLRNGALALYRSQLAFAVTDPATNAVYRWKPAVGVTVLTGRQTGSDALQLGLQFAEDKDIEWGLTVSLSQGTCYWIFPLIRTAGR